MDKYGKPLTSDAWLKIYSGIVPAKTNRTSPSMNRQSRWHRVLTKAQMASFSKHRRSTEKNSLFFKTENKEQRWEDDTYIPNKNGDAAGVQEVGQLHESWCPAANQEMDDEGPSKPETSKEVRDVPLCPVGFPYGRYWPPIAVSSILGVFFWGVPKLMVPKVMWVSRLNWSNFGWFGSIYLHCLEPCLEAMRSKAETLPYDDMAATQSTTCGV